MRSKTVNIIGLGYIGLPTAALLANHGYNVFGTDIIDNTVAKINKGKSHFFEPELEAYVHSAVSANKLRASTFPKVADIYIICVPTPIDYAKGVPKPNIESIIRATHSITKFLKPGNLVILESTSPVGTTEKIEKILKKSGVNVDEIHIAYCPERVLPGRIMFELVNNDRIVGGLNQESTLIIANFYKTFVKGRVFETNARTAELCKLTENSFRDVNIAFANELSLICDKEDINVWDLIYLANKHPRVNILQPGPGVGGHCIAVDPWFIVDGNNKDTKMIQKAREVNNNKTDWVVKKIKSAIDENTMHKDKKVKLACFGLTFKPDVDDVRGSPALQIILKLQSKGYEVVVVEPNIMFHENVSLVTLDEAMNQANIFAILVKHKQFLVPKIKNLLADKKVLDFCNAFG